MLTSAAARLISAIGQINAGYCFSPLIGKFSTARCVCAPYSASAGTSIVPSESFSLRVAMLMLLMDP